MDYQSCLEYLYGLQFFGIKLGLENTRSLLGRMDNPQRKLRIIHIAGTNGKGSTAAVLEQILRTLGFRTGLYTSPHIHSFTERIRLNNQPISEDEVVTQTRKISACCSDLSPTFFEFTTIMALNIFAENAVDWVVLETGMGGRLDATNVVEPQLCLLTPVARDHDTYLGDSLAEIATEKAGIIKPGVPVISSAQPQEVSDVFHRVSDERGSLLREIGRDYTFSSPPAVFAFKGARLCLEKIQTSLNGEYQRENISLALAALEQLLPPGRLAVEEIYQALDDVRWPGRLEWCGDFLLDGAHNPHAAEALAAYLRSENLNDLLWILAVKSDKDALDLMGPVLPYVDQVFAVPLQAETSVATEVLAEIAGSAGVASACCVSAQEALAQALQTRGAEQKILIAGSLYLVGELRESCLNLCEAEQ